MQISVQEVQDFCYCSTFYKYKYIDKIPTEISLKDAFEDAIHTTIYFFYNTVLDQSKAPTLKQLRNKWHLIWDKRVTPREFVTSVTVNSKKYNEPQKRTLYRQGLKIVGNFFDLYGKFPGTPLLVGKEYNIELGKYRLCGTLELVRDVSYRNNPLIEIIDFRTPMKDVLVPRDIPITAASLAFRALFKLEEAKLVYHNLRTGAMIIAKRNMEDYEMLLKIISNIDKALKHKIFLPAISHRCVGCPYARHCLKELKL